MVLGKRDIDRISSPKKLSHKVKRIETPSAAACSNVKVYVRVRPFNQSEKEKNQRNIIKIIDSKNLIFDPKEDHTPFFFHGVKQKLRDPAKKVNKDLAFSFDSIFGPESSNTDVYEETTKHIIKTLLDGYNCSVFSYGATGAGKTHTMLGNDNNKGIMYLTMVELYEELNKLKTDRNIELGVAYVEVYNESVHDLLDPSNSPLHLREENSQVQISGMAIKQVDSEVQLFELLIKGNKNRTQHATDANAESSRSHAVFQVFVKMSDKFTSQVKHFKLSMIDLAGSERAAATQCKGMRFKEGSNINKSLLALGNCINALVEGQRYVPYRDSKLTRLLKDSLGGNCKTIMIANLGPSAATYEDSYNTLKYADRAKNIKSKLSQNVLSVNLNPAVYKKMVADLRKENDLLKTQVQKLSQNQKTSGPLSNQVASAAKLKEWKDKLQQEFNQKDALTTELLNLESHKIILDWRIKLKRFDLQRVSKLENGIESSGSGQNRIEMSLSQLEGRLSGIIDAINSTKGKLEAKNLDITNLIREIKKNGIYSSLSSDIENLEYTLRYNEINQRCTHAEKLVRLQTVRLDDREQTLTKMSEISEEYFLLLKGYNKLTDEMEQAYKTMWKEIKSVSWDDSDFNLDQLENNFILKPLKLFNDASKMSTLESPNETTDKNSSVTAPKASSSSSISSSSSTIKSIGSNSLNGTFIMPPAINLPPPSKKKLVTNLKPRNGFSARKGPLCQTPLRQTPVPDLKLLQLNKENRPMSDSKTLSSSKRTPNLKSVDVRLPTPGKTASLSISLKNSNHVKKRHSISKMLPRDVSKRRSLLKALTAANQISTVQFSKTPSRFKKI